MKSANKKNRGFSLIEMLIAIFIIGVGLVGTLSFLSVNSANQTETKKELIAAGLAQEGTELIRSLKDYRTLNGVSWSQLTSSDVLEPNRLTKCVTIDQKSLTGSPRDCNNGVNNYICRSSGRYQQCDSGTGVEMQRIISVTLQPDSSLKVISTVSWNGRTTTAQDILYK